MCNVWWLKYRPHQRRWLKICLLIRVDNITLIYHTNSLTNRVYCNWKCHYEQLIAIFVLANTWKRVCGVTKNWKKVKLFRLTNGSKYHCCCNFFQSLLSVLHSKPQTTHTQIFKFSKNSIIRVKMDFDEHNMSQNKVGEMASKQQWCPL